MIDVTLGELAGATGGRLIDADPAALLRGPAVLDSRAVGPGALFVAVAGEHVDGHDYARSAAAAGAVVVLASRRVDAPHLLVDDTTLALGRVAAHVRGLLGGVQVVGLTGSQGKTSTKDLLGGVLATAGPVVAPSGNLNNELGVPLTLLQADASTAYLVVEMGARGGGHVRYLCDLASPTVGVVLNVGTAHVGEFGSREATARAKGELVESLPDDGVAVLNADDPLVLAMAGRTGASVVTFGASPASDVRVERLRADELGRPRFDLVSAAARAPVGMQLFGDHHARNAAATAAVALALGLPLDRVADALSSATATSRWRMERQVRADGVVVVNDAYNASPDSVGAALRTLAVMGRAPDAGRTVAVLGEMRELGESSRTEHDAVGRLAAQLGVDRLVVVGDAARAIHRGAEREGSWDGESVLVGDTDAATAYLREHLAPGDVVLVKASRAARLERVAEALLDTAPGGAGEPRETSGR